MTVTVSRQRPDAAPSLAGAPMRATVDGLPSPRPFGEQVPAALQEDEFCQRLLGALDEVLAPVFNVLDCLDSYLDPQLAPGDFVEWLAGWVGVEVDETWSLERRRDLIRDAVALYRVRGTAAGVAAHVRLYAGVTPEIHESGGTDWSQNAGSPLPGSATPHLSVRLRVDGAPALRRSTVVRIVDAARPAHMPFDVEIEAGGSVVEGAGDADEDEDGAASADARAPGAVALPGSERIELAPQGPPDGDGAGEAEAEAAGPETAEAGDAEPGAPEPGDAEPGAPEPGAGEPDATGPDGPAG